MKLNKGSALAPFWGRPVNLITGLDPLGLQTTSEALYTWLLPGVTNLTNRARYYGFYCWLIDLYHKREKTGNSFHQRAFMRRAELLVAIIMQDNYPEVQQITGSTFASGMIESNEEGFYDLKLGADQDKSDSTYWKFHTGAFGQYYFGAMRALGLVQRASNAEGDTIFRLTEREEGTCGQQYARCFDIELDDAFRNLFYESVKNGRLYKKDIDVFIRFLAISTVDSDTLEWGAYRTAFLGPDDPFGENEELGYHRRDTILSLIQLARQQEGKFDPALLLSACYAGKLSEDETAMGWYCYQINEYWQFACGLIFWSILQDLANRSVEQYLSFYIKDMSDDIAAEICKLLDIGYSEAVLLQDILDLIDGEGLSENGLLFSFPAKEGTSTVLAARDAFLSLMVTLKHNRNELDELYNFIQVRKLIRDGDFHQGLSYLLRFSGKSLAAFIELFLNNKIINRHQFVALRKMGNGQQSTQKFIIDEGYIRLVEIYPPNFTSPRFTAIRNILADMQVIDANNELTQLSHQFFGDDQ
ncbi:hypothetical protein SRABI27_03074 [Pedobacter sp. Bi27]|uniref:hypothetical protein n=1 Tax=Pedobacter sp. Bi27 TaxID=2822351 RepID=UPI001D1ADB37|nr:hypothetical protein [Pedobacter sp. Bi27]CAH0255371.1 hypothetical protein SRABI27_03074 [Pedobacter sp. Bi27]